MEPFIESLVHVWSHFRRTCHFFVKLLRTNFQLNLNNASRRCFNLAFGHIFATCYFQTFLGQKYGYRPFPAKIPACQFEKLLGAVDNEQDHRLLTHWFWRDDNAVPAQYELQPITSLLPHYRDYENNELRKKASSDWWEAFERMQVVLRAAAAVRGVDMWLPHGSRRY